MTLVVQPDPRPEREHVPHRGGGDRRAKPDVILTEALGPTEAAFLSEVKQLNGGKMIPVIGTSATISPDWFKSVSAAIGGSTLAADFSADNLVTETCGPGVPGVLHRRSTPRRARSAARATSRPT